MKISVFAELNNVTAKMLRHYDEIGLLKPSAIDSETGYRSYEPEQAHLLPSALNEQIQKKITIDQLITIIEKEGFEMDKKVDLLNMEQTDVHEIKKNIPNMEVFLETAANIVALCSKNDNISVFRFDISHFKQVNDDYGFDVGDNVIVACFQMIESNVRTYLSNAAIGRAHGDEFVVFAKAGKEAIIQTAQSIIEDMNNYNFSSIGCPKQMGCYIGGLVGHHTNTSDIRRIIEDSIESLNHARKKGSNSITIDSYPL